jgi:hypothetical protein
VSRRSGVYQHLGTALLGIAVGLVLVVVSQYLARNYGERPDAGPRGAEAPYSREAFGRAWADVDRDGCDQRNQILARDLEQVVLASDGCVVLRGVLVDPYTGQREAFVRGTTTSRLVQIDHIYSLRDAWDDGLAGAGKEQVRLQFANDPRNLVASLDNVNAAKGSLTPVEWSDNAVDRCPYQASYQQVASAYGLDVDSEVEGFLAAESRRCSRLLTER